MRFIKWIPLLLACLLAACAQQPARKASTRHSPASIDYAKYVQGSVLWFQFTSLYNWNPTNQLGSVVVWTTPNRAYLLILAGPCLGLQNAFTLGLTSFSGVVSSGRDDVIAGRDRCRIMRIQTLDAKAIRARRAKPESSAAAQD